MIKSCFINQKPYWLTKTSIRDGLITIFEWYRLESFWKFNEFDTPTQELVELVKYREKKLRDNFGYVTPPFEEELFNMLANMALDAFNSLADFYLSQNEKDEALSCLKKAYELSGREYYRSKIQKIEKGDL